VLSVVIGAAMAPMALHTIIAAAESFILVEVGCKGRCRLIVDLRLRQDLAVLATKAVLTRRILIGVAVMFSWLYLEDGNPPISGKSYG
jgi:hypothetical protein